MFLKDSGRSSYRELHRVYNATHNHQEGYRNHRTKLQRRVKSHKNHFTGIPLFMLYLPKANFVTTTHGRFVDFSRQHRLQLHCRPLHMLLLQCRSTHSHRHCHRRRSHSHMHHSIEWDPPIPKRRIILRKHTQPQTWV